MSRVRVPSLTPLVKICFGPDGSTSPAGLATLLQRWLNGPEKREMAWRIGLGSDTSSVVSTCLKVQIRSTVGPLSATNVVLFMEPRLWAPSYRPLQPGRIHLVVIDELAVV